MKGWLRSWKLCEVRREEDGGRPGWRKRRLARAAWLIPPGNLCLWAIDSGCRMTAGREWAECEVATFRAAHPEQPAPRVVDRRQIWLPHLPGVLLSGLRGGELASAAQLAFAELGRFHRLDGLPIHGDPHAKNFLYDRQGGLCRIIDFETTGAGDPARGRAQDFLILAMHLWKLDPALRRDFGAWQEAYENSGENCPAAELLTCPGFRLGWYWRLLGYDPSASRFSSALRSSPSPPP